MSKNIILIGFRATGKTTIGKLLAQKLNKPFIDTDILIEKRAGKTIAEIVKEEGWSGFRKREKMIIKELAEKEDIVLALGGGAILDAENVECLKKNGIFIWLKAKPETILKRLYQDKKTTSQRPSLTGKSLDAEINQILKERLPIYENIADISIDTDKMLPEEIIKIIMEERWQKQKFY
ncbi:MAG: shikimate kinase AroL [Candidatus Desulfofervidus auxilii]|nr:shikimate kinase AroL [Candidatus Desulfofervidus auxilii]